MDEYVFRAEWQDEAGRPIPESGLRTACRDRLKPGLGPWRFMRYHVNEDGERRVETPWTRYRGRPRGWRTWRHLLITGNAGDVVLMEPKHGPLFKARVVKMPAAARAVEKCRAVAYSLLGAPYVFGDLDCSGFTLRCVQIATGIVLPHAARLQQDDPRVAKFVRPEKAEPFDLVFMWFPNSRGISRGTASHVGFFLRPGLMLDTRSPADPVSTSQIEPGAFIEFGRIAALNGKL